MNCPKDGHLLLETYDEQGIPILHCALCNGVYETEFDGSLTERQRELE